MSQISQYMNADLIAFIDVATREEALDAVVALLDQEDMLHDRQQFFDAIIERERVVSTGIGMGVALPHAKLPVYEDFFIAVAICKRGVDWQALDGALVRLILMIGGPDDKQTEYLQLLSALTIAIKDEERRKKILTSNSKESIIALFEGE